MRRGCTQNVFITHGGTSCGVSLAMTTGRASSSKPKTCRLMKRLRAPGIRCWWNTVKEHTYDPSARHSPIFLSYAFDHPKNLSRLLVLGEAIGYYGTQIQIRHVKILPGDTSWPLETRNRPKIVRTTYLKQVSSKSVHGVILASWRLYWTRFAP